MSIFAIGDLHLSGSGEKPMDVFGQQWDKHFDVICRHWRELVKPEDTVLIPGDISWAMQLEQAMVDLRSIAELPGRKILLRGNHDYWWSSITKLRENLPPDMLAVQNDSLMVEGWAVCGTRGWNFPTEQNPLGEQDQKIYQRELIRLEMALQNAKRRELPILAMLHFPPLLVDFHQTGFTELLERYQVKRVVYGHLHGAGIQNGFTGVQNGVAYQLVSCDAIGFCPVKITE